MKMVLPVDGYRSVKEFIDPMTVRRCNKTEKKAGAVFICAEMRICILCQIAVSPITDHQNLGV